MAGQLFDEADKELGQMYYHAATRLYLALLSVEKLADYFDCYECGAIG